MFQQFIEWIQHCIQEMRQQKEALVIQVYFYFFIYCIAIIFVVATRDLNGFDLFFLVAEAKCHKLDEISLVEQTCIMLRILYMIPKG